MPAKPRSYVAVIKAAERALRAGRVDHVFVGGVAVLAFGEPRMTMDVDVIAAYRRDAVPSLAKEFRREGFRASPGDLRDALSDRSHRTIDDLRSEYRIDLVPATTAAALHAIADRVTVRWRGISLPIASPEHTIAMKLVFGGEQDIEDAMRVYVRQRARLDFRRMREFAQERGVSSPLRDLEQKARALGERKSRSRRH